MNGCQTTDILPPITSELGGGDIINGKSLKTSKMLMMERDNSNRTRRITLRLSPEEYNKLESKFKASTCRKLSDHIRKQLFNKPIISTYRNQSLDDLMEETIVLNSELKAIGVNINQMAKKLNMAKQIPEFRDSIFHFENNQRILFNKIDQIRYHTQNIAERWLQL